MRNLISRSLIAVLSLGAFAAMGQADMVAPESSPSPTTFSLSYRSAFNIKSSFKHVGFIGNSNPGSAARATDHFYDDGYNRVDSTGNDHFGDQSTTFWGYQNDSQYDSSGTGTIAMHSASSPGGNGSGHVDDPSSGAEVAFTKELVRHENWRGGFEGAFDYQRVSANSSGTFNSTVTHITDVYQLNGVIPPGAPYDGPSDQPGPLLGDTPTRTITTAPETVTGSRSFDANLFGLRAGPYAEIPLNDIFSINVSGGIVVACAQSDYQVNQSVTIDTGTTVSNGSDSHTGVLVGGYVGGSVSATISGRCSLFAGAQWQHLGTYRHHSGINGGGTAELNLDNPIFISAGVGVSF